MLSVNEIDKTILELEQKDTTYAVCEKLAWLYIVRDHLVKPADAEALGRMSGSEFMQAISGKDMAGVMNVLDEHMEVVKMLHPKEYNAIIKKLMEM